ncbi:MAG TPA: 3-methyl-2-oxobutanoate hydroxymethyltransferase [Vicinamibacteria bacterium]|nr:3-methyl-2-oxobutanoate hydroxymethyltransferase [Vicinamibacteria bacterium]
MRPTDRPTLLNGCARAATAAEARFRVPYANSHPRSSCVVALDPRAEAALRPLAGRQWRGARFRAWDAVEHGLRGLEGLPRPLEDELQGVDLVVLVAGGGEGAAGAQALASLCAARRLQPVGIVVSTHPSAAAALRDCASVLVSSADEEYLADMLTAMRA